MLIKKRGHFSLTRSNSKMHVISIVFIIVMSLKVVFIPVEIESLFCMHGLLFEADGVFSRLFQTLVRLSQFGSLECYFDISR